MKRKHLIHNIQLLDQRLTAQLAPFQQRSDESIQAVRQINPLWLVATGLIAGMVTGRLSWRGAFAAGNLGFQAHSLARSGLNLWMRGIG